MIKVNFGAGQCHVEGWRNTDACYPDGPDRIDATKPLPFADGSVDMVFSEMMLEHITPQQSWNFLCECYRILKPNGLIRIVIPDFVRCWKLKDPDWLRVNQGVTNNDGSLRDQMKSILFCHGHQGLWTSELLQAVMQSIGFNQVGTCEAGESRLGMDNLEQHHHSVGKRIAAAESGCVEAIR